MITAYCILHYGKEWLQYAVRSVIDQVDEFHIFYTPYPSHGHGTNRTNPETRVMLYYEVMGYIGHGLYWHDCLEKFVHEGYHREFAARTCIDRGADLIVVVDADEIWPADVLKESIQEASSTYSHSFRINMRHFWRSLNWVCDDPACPTRIVKPSVPDGNEYYLGGKVFHMGYAQSSAIVDYKMQIHGHKNELRRNWFANKFMAWKPGMTDVHPTCENNFWEPKPYVDDGTLKKLIGDHPYWGMEIIP